MRPETMKQYGRLIHALVSRLDGVTYVGKALLETDCMRDPKIISRVIAHAAKYVQEPEIRELVEAINEFDFPSATDTTWSLHFGLGTML